MATLILAQPLPRTASNPATTAQVQRVAVAAVLRAVGLQPAVDARAVEEAGFFGVLACQERKFGVNSE